MPAPCGSTPRQARAAIGVRTALWPSMSASPRSGRSARRAAAPRSWRRPVQGSEESERASLFCAARIEPLHCCARDELRHEAIDAGCGELAVAETLEHHLEMVG